MSMRTEDDAGTAGQQDLHDAGVARHRRRRGAERLAAVQRSTLASKEQSQAVEARADGRGRRAAARGAARPRRAGQRDASTAPGTTAQIGNVCVTNVPGSQVPLYLRGAQMQAYYSLGPVYDNAGPIHLVVSYLGKIYLSVTTCREIMPDLSFYIECLRNSLTELADETLGPDERRVLATPSNPPAKKVTKRAVKKNATASSARTRARSDGAGRPPARRPRDREVR